MIEKIKAVMIGHAVGDALGVPVEREVTYTARVVGIVILSVALVVAVATIIIYKKRKKAK